MKLQISFSIMILAFIVLLSESCSSQKSNESLPPTGSNARPATGSKNTTNNMNNDQNPNNDRPIPPVNNTDKPTNQPPTPPPPKPNVGKDCFDPAKATNEICPRLYEPVCGCNGVTYANSCLAKNAGVLKWTPGECKN